MKVNKNKRYQHLEITCGVCYKNYDFQRKYGLKWKAIYDSPKFQNREPITKK